MPVRSVGILRSACLGQTRKVRARPSAPMKSPNSKITLSLGAGRAGFTARHDVVRRQYQGSEIDRVQDLVKRLDREARCREHTVCPKRDGDWVMLESRLNHPSRSEGFARAAQEQLGPAVDGADEAVPLSQPARQFTGKIPPQFRTFLSNRVDGPLRNPGRHDSVACYGACRPRQGRVQQGHLTDVFARGYGCDFASADAESRHRPPRGSACRCQRRTRRSGRPLARIPLPSCGRPPSSRGRSLRGHVAHEAYRSGGAERRRLRT